MQDQLTKRCSYFLVEAYEYAIYRGFWVLDISMLMFLLFNTKGNEKITEVVFDSLLDEYKNQALTKIVDKAHKYQETHKEVYINNVYDLYIESDDGEDIKIQMDEDVAKLVKSTLDFSSILLAEADQVQMLLYELIELQFKEFEELVNLTYGNMSRIKETLALEENPFKIEFLNKNE